VLALINHSFVPVAIDQHIHRRLKDEEGQFFAKVLRQAGRGLGGHSQGVYLCTPEGKLLGFRNTADADSVRRLLTTALMRFDPDRVKKLESSKHDLPLPEPPEGGLVVDVTTKVLLEPTPETDERSKRYLSSLGRDHLWIRKDEAQALARGELPESIKYRLARYHLIDNTRGEPPLWRRDEIKKLELTLKDGRLQGTVHLETNSGQRGYHAQLLGVIEARDGKVVRFDVVVKGQFWGHGTYTRFAAPEGKFPLAIAFTLSDGKAAIDRVPPGGARGNVSNYLR
jgi:hypothetical protein